MNTNYKKVLVIHYDPNFAEPILELLRKPDIETVLANGFSEGEEILKKEKFNLVIIECPVTIDTEILSKFTLQTIPDKILVFLVAKEKMFLAGLESQSNVSIFDQDEIHNQISSFVDNINK